MNDRADSGQIWLCVQNVRVVSMHMIELKGSRPQATIQIMKDIRHAAVSSVIYIWTRTACLLGVQTKLPVGFQLSDVFK